MTGLTGATIRPGRADKLATLVPECLPPDLATFLRCERTLFDSRAERIAMAKLL